MVSKKFWRSKKSFLSNNRAWSNLPPPISVAEKTSKSAKILPMGTSTKTRKHDYQSQNVKMENFPKKTYLSGFRQKFSKIRQSFKG